MLQTHLSSGTVCLKIPVLYLIGPIHLSYSLSYDSSSKYENGVGLKWKVPYDISLKISDETIILYEQGEESFHFANNNTVPSKKENGYSLQKTSSDGYVVTLHDEKLQYFFQGNSSLLKIKKIMSANSNEMSFLYDKTDNLIRIADPFKRVLIFTHVNDRIKEIVLSSPRQNGRSVVILKCSYDSSNRLVTATTRNNAKHIFTYKNEHLVKYTNPMGGVYCAKYDIQSHRCVKTWEKSGGISKQFYFDLVKHRTLVVNSLGYKTLYQFNEKNQLEEITDSLGGIWQYIRDGEGNLISKVNPEGEIDSASHISDDSNVYTSIDAAGNVRKLIFDDDGEVKEKVDACENSWLYEYDDTGNPIQITTPTGMYSRLKYNNMGQLKSVSTPNGNNIKYQYSSDSSQLKISDTEGLIKDLSFDMFGNILTYKDNFGNVTQRIDSLAFSQSIDSSGGKKLVEYDLLGNPITIKNELGEEYILSYDKYGRLRKVIAPLNQEITYEYDTEGLISAIINESGERYEFTRNAIGKIVTEKQFDGIIQRYEYNSLSRVIAKTLPSGKKTHIERDPNGIPHIIEYHDKSREIRAFDGEGRLLEAHASDSSLYMEYDPEGRCVKEINDNYEVNYTYGTEPYPSKIICECEGVLQTFTYDVRFRLKSASANDQVHAKLEYNDAENFETIHLSSGLFHTRRYNKQLKIEEQTLSSQNGRIIYFESYKYDKTGNLIERIRKDGPVFTFTHDLDGSLVQVQQNNKIIFKYIYDATGNLKSKQGGSYFNEKQTYDSDGQLTYIERNNLSASCKYSESGLLETFTQINEQGVDYSYDPIYRRIQKKTKKSVTETLWTQYHPLLDKLSDDTNIEYLFHPVMFTLLFISIDDQWYYAINDFHGETTCLVNIDSEEIEWASDPLGFESDVYLDKLNKKMPCRGMGQFWDKESDLYYQWARYFDPSIARFLTPDPLGLQTGLNFYKYCENQPFLFVDPLGLASCSPKSVEECTQIFNRLYKNRNKLEDRWNESFDPNYVLPLSGAPPKGNPIVNPVNIPFLTATGSANGKPSLSLGDGSLGSVDTHIDSYYQEQGGMKNRILDYYQGDCDAYADDQQRRDMKEICNWSEKEMSLPAYGF